MEESVKVKLLVDLTRYADGLVAGIEGYTIGHKGMWSRANDNFVTVCFPKIATLDVLWKSLEIIDEDYLKKVDEENKRWYEKLKTAKNVELHLGPKGGFRSLMFEYMEENQVTSHYAIGFRGKAYKIIEFFKENNIPIKEIIEK